MRHDSCLLHVLQPSEFSFHATETQVPRDAGVRGCDGTWLGWGNAGLQTAGFPRGTDLVVCFGVFWSFGWKLDGERMFPVRAAHISVSSSSESVDCSVIPVVTLLCCCGCKSSSLHYTHFLSHAWQSFSWSERGLAEGFGNWLQER